MPLTFFFSSQNALKKKNSILIKKKIFVGWGELVNLLKCQERKKG